jgi:hypothetical protein
MLAFEEERQLIARLKLAGLRHLTQTDEATAYLFRRLATHKRLVV